MEIKNPRRILALGAPEAGVLTLLKGVHSTRSLPNLPTDLHGLLDLTGTAPELVSDSTAGLTHHWSLETRYYTATLPIWIDEITDIEQWRSEFIKPEAKEVVSVLGAWIVCFRKPTKEEDVASVKDTLKAIADVIEHACGYSGDAVCLAVAMPQSMTPSLEKSAEDWEELCLEYGFEFVDSEAKGKNEFGEDVGIKRIEEALKAHEWDGDDTNLGFDDNDEFGESFDAEEMEMGMELFGMKAAVNGTDEAEGEAQVEELESIMRRMMGIKGWPSYPTQLTILHDVLTFSQK
jgi:hypothetical protein